MEQKTNYDLPSKQIVIALSLVLAFTYATTKSVYDFIIGKDSLWSRHLYREVYTPALNIYKMLNKNRPLETEEQFQRALGENRQNVKMKGLADIIEMFP